jgi:5'-3' exonuclease
MTQYPALGHTVVAGGQDKDVYQALSTKARMYDSSHKPEPKWITVEKAEKAKGVPVSKMIMYQTLLGDKIDDVPQILSPAKAKTVCLKHKSIKAWFEAADKETKTFIRANQAKMMINRQLVELKTDMALPDPETLKPPKIRLEGMPKAWYAHQDLCWPKRKSLFG